MSVTTSLVIGPQYEQIEGVGITPENQVTLSIADLKRGVDTQLDAALTSWLPPDRSRRFSPVLWARATILVAATATTATSDGTLTRVPPTHRIRADDSR
jgi:hypothetical protein